MKSQLVLFAWLLAGCSAPSHSIARVSFGPTPFGPTASPYRSPAPPPVLSVPLGHILWRQTIDGAGKRPVYTAGFVNSIVANSKALATYDSRSGSLLSIHPLALDQIAGSGNVLYGLDTVGHVLRIDPQSGRIRWRTPAGKGSIVADAQGPIQVNPEGVIAYRSDGSIAWKRSLIGGNLLQDPIRFVRHKVIIPYQSDGAWLTEGIYSIDRASGRLYGSYGPGGVIGFGGGDLAYAAEDYFGDLDYLCCSATLDYVDLIHTHPRGDPADVFALDRSSRKIEPDLQENAAREKPCDNLHLPFVFSSQAMLAKIDDGVAFWAAGRLYDATNLAVRRTGLEDECPIGESSGAAMFSARPDRLDLVTRRNGSFVVLPVLHVERTAIVTTLITPGRFYVEVGNWLYAIDPDRARPIARWNIPCREWNFVGRTGRADILVCPARSLPERDAIYALE